MRKLLLLLMVLCAVSNYTWSQRTRSNQYTITLNGNSISPQEDFKEVKEGMKAKYGKSVSEELGWFIVQFKSIPTSQEKNLLKNQGVELLSYVQGYAYYASISKKFLSVDAKNQKNFRSILSIKPEYKINPDLLADETPDYAKDGELVKVVITYFKNANLTSIEKNGIAVKLKNKVVQKEFHQIRASVLKSEITKIASADWVQGIEMAEPPYEADNFHGKTLHRANVLSSTITGLGYGLTGKGMKIGLWDGDVENHRDFNGRVINREYESHTSNHGTHTCGTITSAGLIDPKARGMAPEAQVYAWNFNTQSNGLSVPSEMLKSLQEDGIEMSSNSYGYNVTSCPNPYAYNLTDYNEDLIANWFPYYLIVFSAGNNQTICPSGYFTTSKNIKNSLLVAAVDQTEGMSSFSSFGPSKDGRLIPNISGDGVDVYSTYFNNGYGFMSGTSMATPGVAGTMALVYQRYKEINGGEKPISSLMRALACNTAYDLGNPGPDYKYGYGAINGVRAVEVLEKKSFFTDSVAHGDKFSKNITIPTGAVALKVMLVWTDAPGTVGASKILVNDLDLSVSNGNTKTLPWVLDPKNPSANAFRDYDGLNNIEQVTIDHPVAGTYTINIEGYEIPDGKQEFAVVYDIVMPNLKLTYPIGGENFTPGNQEVIRWDCNGYTNSFTLEYSIDGGNTYSVLASNIPSHIRSYLWTVPTGAKSNIKFRITNGSTLSVNKGIVTIMPTPKNVRVGKAQCGGDGPFALQWDAIADAKYEVLKLNGQNYERIAEVSTNSYGITNISHSNDNWFCVRAIDLSTGAISERSLAVNVNPSVAVQSLPYSNDFESQTAENFFFTSVYGQGNVRYVNTANRYGIRLEGPTTYSDWVNAADEYCFTSNPNYVVTGSICNIDASSLAGKKMILKFDYRLKYRTAVGTSYFRVKVNGNYLPNTEGTTIYGASAQVNYKTVYYDLSAFAGMSNLNIEFEAVCKTNYTIYVNSSGNYDFSNDTYDKGDFVTIDNIAIEEPAQDLALTSLSVTSGETENETVTVVVRNLYSETVSDIPVSYQINDGEIVTESVPGPIAPLATASYTFDRKADFRTLGLYTINAKVNWPNDPIENNNSQEFRRTSNGSDILIGTGSPTATCNAVVTDPSGRFADYQVSQTKTHVFNPGAAGKNVKITFTEFATEADFDFLYIYNGNSTSSADLLGMYSGNTLPPSFTSTAADGALTLKFTSDNAINDKGFVATVECVDKPSYDAGVTAITSPASGIALGSALNVSVTVKNFGLQAISNVNVFYQINDNTPVQETVTASIASMATSSFTFAAPADLSISGTYTIKAWTSLTDDEVSSNDAITKTVVNTPSIKDIGITAISTIYPRRGGTSTIAATVKNFGTVSVTGFDVVCSGTIGGPIVQSFTNTISPGATAVITFATKAEFTNVGTYNLRVSTALADDADVSNDATLIDVTHIANNTTNVYGKFKTGNTIATSSNVSQFSLTSNYTVEMWLKPNANPKYGTLFSKGISITHHSNYYPGAYNTNCLLLSIGGQTFMTPSNSITNDVWQHIALTSAADGTIRFYLNGVEQALSISAKAIQAANTTIPVRLGSNSTYSQPYYGGMDEVRVWNSCLDQATIAANMVTDFAANTSGLLAYYKFIELRGNYLYDYSANDNTAIIANADCSGIGEGYFLSTPDNLLTNYSVMGEKVPTTFDKGTNTYYSIMDNSSLQGIKSTFTAVQKSVVKIGATAQESGVTENDFSDGNTKTYTVEGVGFNTGINQTYYVNVTNDKSSECILTSFAFEPASNNGLNSAITLDKIGDSFTKKILSGVDVSALKATFQVSAGAKLLINGVEQTSPQTVATDYSQPLMVTVMSENGRVFKNYSIDVDTRNNEAELLTFEFVGAQVGTASIDKDNHTVKAYVKKNANLAKLKVKYTVSNKAKLYRGSILQRNEITTGDYTSTVELNVISEDESTSNAWTVSVEKDLVKPVITLTGNATETIAHGSTYADAGAVAQDDIEGDISSSIVVTNPVNTGVVGQYVVRYNVTDASGNIADEVVRIVNVTDQTKPQITLTGNATVNVTHNDAYTDAGATATDNVEGDISSKIVVTNPVNTSVVGQYIVRYNVTDEAGNVANEVIRTVNVVARMVSAIAVKGTGNATAIAVNHGTLQMIAEVTPANATNTSVTWSVNNGTGEATISATGLLTAVKNGTVTVKATANDGSSIEGTLEIAISNQGTGIDTQDNTVLSIYPNPVTRMFKVSYSDKWERLDIYNSIGTIVKSVNFTEEVDVAELNSGIYFVNIYTKNGAKISTARFIKQ